jgi:hypothetical protein
MRVRLLLTSSLQLNSSGRVKYGKNGEFLDFSIEIDLEREVIVSHNK